MTTYKTPETFPKYRVSEDGEIFYYARLHKPIKAYVNSNGYLVAGISKPSGVRTTATVATIVAEAWHPEDKYRWGGQSPTVIHKDGNRLNVSASNLTWRTRSYAIRYHEWAKLALEKYPGGVYPMQEIFFYGEDADVNKFQSLHAASFHYGLIPGSIREAYESNRSPVGYDDLEVYIPLPHNKPYNRL